MQLLPATLEVVVERAGPSGHAEQHVAGMHGVGERSEEHTSELQSRLHLVCRLLLEKKKRKNRTIRHRAVRNSYYRKTTPSPPHGSPDSAKPNDSGPATLPAANNWVIRSTSICSRHT